MGTTISWLAQINPTVWRFNLRTLVRSVIDLGKSRRKHFRFTPEGVAMDGITAPTTSRHEYWGLSNPYPGSAPDWLDSFGCYGDDLLQESHGHEYWKLGKGDHNIGGDFKVTRRFYHEGENSQVRDFSTTSNPFSPGRHHRTGQWAHAAYVTNATFPVPPTSSKLTLLGYGTTAIARCLPTNPLSGLSVFLGELREGLPRLGIQSFQRRAGTARSAGSDYLNAEFGWKPLISDLQSFSYAHRNSDELIRKYERNSGKRIKRRYDFPVEESIVVEDLGQQTAVPLLTPTGFYSGSTSGPKIRVKHIRVERWFEGCFTYYLPPYDPGGDNSKRNAILRNYLYGTRVTPETLWNLAPWTWAADWVGNIGDVIHNVSAFTADGLVMPYGYMMETSSYSVTNTLGPIKYVSYPKGFTYSQTVSTVVKQRVKATPYGFGLNPATFTSRQWAILAALGLSKGGNRL